MTETETYAAGLLNEECGEVTQLVGKALRFGIDTPGVKDPRTGHVDMDQTPRKALAVECGDVLAAIEYAALRGVIDGDAVRSRFRAKLARLLDPDSHDNLGRRLAP